MNIITQSLFQSSLMFTVPLGIVILFALLLIPSLLVTGAKPREVAKAINCMLFKVVGIVLIGLSGVQLTYAFITVDLPDMQTLWSLVLLLMLGVGIIVHQSKKEATIDEASLSVPYLIFCHTCEIVGGLIALIAALSVGITYLVSESFAGWEMSATMLLLGTILALTSSLHLSGTHGKKSATKTVRKK